MPCPIWGTPAQSLEKAGDFEVFDSPRAGGRYWISGTALGQIGTFTLNAKLLLTSWLCEQRRVGAQEPKIRSDILDLIRSRRRLSVPLRLTAALRFVGENIDKLGSYISVSEDDDADTLRCMAETESETTQEVIEILGMLRETGYVEGEPEVHGVRPTAGGWQELERLQQTRTDSSQAFVAMWFNESTQEAYTKGIAKALSAVGYKAVRIDKKEHNNKIDDEIVAEIRRSRFLVADFTCAPKEVRGGVYYEAGFAQGLGIPVIWTVKDSSLDDLHFDTRQYAHIVWQTADDLFEQLRNRVGRTIGDGPLPKI
jgi:nucleoside 2-deoxyribosyltransferase